eukprot:scaffold521_cov167-Amphora_coffeaeformis.AAC.24
MDKQSSKDPGEERERGRNGADSLKDSPEPGSRASSSPQTLANHDKSGLLDLRPNARDEKSKTGSKDDTEQKEASVASSSTEGDGGTNASESSSGGKAPQDGSLPKKPKKDRSNLRKGKWTVEEEEYTSRIIHYFGTGLLTLPEGSTLRSYLADKLNCDPMRITKKYAGASCLGRRVHQFRDRPTPTITEIHLAKAELDHLEQRFRMRVEEGYSSLPLSPPADLMLSFSQQANQFLMNPTAGASPAPPTGLPPWLFGLGLNPQQQQFPAPPSIPGLSQGRNGLADKTEAFPGLAQLGAMLPWLLPNATGTPAPPMAPPPASTGIPNVDAAMASWAFAQAAASLAPAITQLAAANLHQQRQMQQPPKPPPMDPMKELSNRLQESRETENLRQALQAAMAGRAPNVSSSPSMRVSPQINGSQSAQIAQLAAAAARPSQIPSAKQQQKEPPVADAKPATISPKPQRAAPSVTGKRSRTTEDQQAGDILLGFLSSLRQSYEEAVREKEHGRKQSQTSQQQNNQNTSQLQQHQSTSLQDAVDNMNQRRPRVPQVSDTSSGVSSSTGQPESSVEESDWHSDKKTETSSSEDSDKEVSGKGPPRKRLKTKRAADERQRMATASKKQKRV